MKVTEAKPALTSEPVASVEMYPEPASQDDIHWFSSQLNNNAAAPDNSVAATSPGMMSGITESISSSQRAQKDAFHDLSIASKSSNPEDFAKANAQLSNYYIESLMNAKVISKGVQSLDKLTNLQ
ncbi:EscI/YscI/HrpB family type III secretion system inner rod protein [Erwiniaceae bacterium BAC15a-03b]|uniref:EscI/YscI/HrpB family type III secretion system inner rod protein n=1 Tax=Winslowiella arboricola TaxID=2978220 RepID=A0A9J6PM02_9GAMM|nr:EscI/YscI/HrpB family type III secretion system inner rod protein [Winslowiella arboricola]MCU5773691.1 EscI/YscI/HrpB family type III secretion system inner rod protein [Winslowiella arboricola]MCU5778410.1 EscI/YscI/HrpB family type III secretion system inner rod protein [Winslowiella arboricola]